LRNMYENNRQYSAYYGYDLADDESIEAYQDYLLKMMIEPRVKQYKAEQSGLKLTSEELAQAKEKAQKSYDDTYQSFLDAAKDSGASDVRAQANKLFTNALSNNHTTVRKMKKEFLSEAEGDLFITKHKDQLLSGVEADDEALALIYEEKLADQQELFDANVSMYFTQELYYSYGYDYVPLYKPEGLIRVRQILVEDEETAQEVYEKISQGEDFEKLIAEYNIDPGMETNLEGYLVGEGASFVEEFLEAALALEADGDIADVVQSEYGYHIIKRTHAEPSGVIPYKDIQGEFESFAKTTYLQNYYDKLVDSWMEEGFVVYYPENYRSIGKAS